MRKLTTFNICCITLLWLFLCYMLIKGYGGLTIKGAFIIITSGIIVFVPIYKKYRKER
ncbi:MAG: hypothetical protein RR293_02515 [Bacteroidales bacterium]